MKNFQICALFFVVFYSPLAWATTSCYKYWASPSVVCLADTPWLKFDVYVNGTYTHMVLPQQLQFHANERIYTQGKVYDAQIDPKSNAVLLALARTV